MTCSYCLLDLRSRAVDADAGWTSRFEIAVGKWWAARHLGTSLARRLVPNCHNRLCGLAVTAQLLASEHSKVMLVTLRSIPLKSTYWRLRRLQVGRPCSLSYIPLRYGVVVSVLIDSKCPTMPKCMAVPATNPHLLGAQLQDPVAPFDEGCPWRPGSRSPEGKTSEVVDMASRPRGLHWIYRILE